MDLDTILLIAICVFALYYLLNSCFYNKTNEGFYDSPVNPRYCNNICNSVSDSVNQLACCETANWSPQLETPQYYCSNNQYSCNN
jgi:hypothetical protein